MPEITPALIGVLICALIFEFINGFHDTANAIATTVYTRALPARTAILLSALMNFVGALTSESVAMTIAKGIVNDSIVTLSLNCILAALLGAIIWDLFTWWRAIPSSSSHALIGSLVGATLVFATIDSGSGGVVWESVQWDGVVNKVIIPIFTSPLIGFALGYVFMRIVFEVFANWPNKKATGLFHKAQIASSLFMAYSHGNNDAQKTMGIVTIALITAGMDLTGVPVPVKIICAATMALGTAIGGGRIMKTVGSGVTKLEPALGFVTQCASGIAIEIMTFLGAPVSTTQVITTSIMGAGTAKGAKRVKWGMAGEMVTAWVITLPITMVLGGIIAFILEMILKAFGA